MLQATLLVQSVQMKIIIAIPKKKNISQMKLFPLNVDNEKHTYCVRPKAKPWVGTLQ